MESINDADTTADDITVLRSASPGSDEKETSTPRVLKQRFVLEEKLGAGGMGTVYRARDLRKVEARDRHPYVAVKVLNADFRHHPDAFIALQREASKSQAIAHPNIVSIFDFDKDGDIPYMVMELLEGRELTRLLRDYPNGIPDDIAWPVVEGLCAGLIRAHDAGITHADFKPGNVYVSGSHEPKIFDFGIARAVRLNQTRGDDTVFDPSRLAALTPAYASREMLIGEAPEPADDIYSFAIVVYLILAGRHPYDRVRADEAQRQDMVPLRIRRLTRRQWRTLERCLAFDRAHRPASMREVARGLIEGPRLGAIGIGVLAAAAAMAAASLWFVATRSEREVVARDAVVDAQSARVRGLLDAPAFDDAWNVKLAEAMNALSTTPGGAARTARLAHDTRVLYGARIEAVDDLLEQARLLAAAETVLGTRFDAGRALIDQRIEASLERFLARSTHDERWLADVEALLDQAAGAYPDIFTGLVARRAVHAYLAELRTLATARETGTRGRSAEPWLAAISHRLAAIDLPDAAAEQLETLEARIERQRARARGLEERRELDRQLAAIDAISCQRIDPGSVARTAKRLAAAYPARATAIEAHAVNAVTRCIAANGEVDQDGAMSLKQSALAAFGSVPALSDAAVDPCGMRYLIGHGTAPGRSGFCLDAFDSDVPSPKLVVVPFGPSGERFGITKYEVSMREAGVFCAETRLCAASDDDTPLRGVGVDVALAYARWLSERTGRTYRLPTLSEWREAADGGVDPNRNCRLQMAGVDRGGAVWPASSGAPNDLGVVNMLGNVQEWALDGDGLVVAGGAYVDPLAQCDAGFARPHDGAADETTGLRLVREIR